MMIVLVIAMVAVACAQEIKGEAQDKVMSDEGRVQQNKLVSVLYRGVRYDSSSHEMCLYVCGYDNERNLVCVEKRLPTDKYCQSSLCFRSDEREKFSRNWFVFLYKADDGREYEVGEVLWIGHPKTGCLYYPRLDFPWWFDLETQQFVMDFTVKDLKPYTYPYTPYKYSCGGACTGRVDLKDHLDRLEFEALDGDVSALEELQEAGVSVSY
jgi:hypothetical protein